MGRKNKGRQKIKMEKMEKENNLQVTFSKRKNGLFKKASEICTLCDVEVATIIFSPSGKAFSFGHPNVDTIIDRFLNNNFPPPNQPTNVQLDEVCQNSKIQSLNNHLTEVNNQLESEQKKNQELKKIRKNTKKPMNWWEESIEGFDIGQVKEFKDNLEILKKLVTFEASKYLQATFCHPNFYVGSSSNAPFGNAPFRVDGGVNINPNLNQLNQIRLMNTNVFYNQNMVLPHHALPFGNNNHPARFVPQYNVNYRPEGNPNGNQNQSIKEENISENEQHHDGQPPHSQI